MLKEDTIRRELRRVKVFCDRLEVRKREEGAEEFWAVEWERAYDAVDMLRWVLGLERMGVLRSLTWDRIEEIEALAGIVDRRKAKGD